MKKILFALLFSCAALVHANDFMADILRRAEEAVDDPFWDEDELCAFYSQEINSLDIEILKENPELVFRRGLSRFYAAESLEDLIEFQKDFQFVMEYTLPEERLYRAAKSKYDEIALCLLERPQNYDDFVKIGRSMADSFLKRWVEDSTLSGRELREAVYWRLKTDETLFKEFETELLILWLDDPDLMLGYIDNYTFEIQTVTEDQEYGPCFRCEFTYDGGMCIYTCMM